MEIKTRAKKRNLKMNWGEHTKYYVLNTGSNTFSSYRCISRNNIIFMFFSSRFVNQFVKTMYI